MRRLRLVATGVVLSLAATLGAASPAAADLFLEVQGVPGESQDEQQPNSIDIRSYSWGASGGGGARPALQELAVVKNVDIASPLLFQRLVTGAQIPSVELIARTPGANPFVYLRLCFQDVGVSSIKQNAGASDNVSTENATFSYAAVSQQYSAQSPDGGIGQTVFAGWNATTGTLIQTYPASCGL